MDTVLDISHSSDAYSLAAPVDLSPLEVQVIDLFVGVVRLIGLPKSLGELYGLLFIATQPLTLDQLVDRLRISKGSASQGLRTLRQIGAAKVVYVPGDRRDHYVAETELKKLVAGFISGQVLPHLESGASRLDRLRALEPEAVAELDPAAAKIVGDRIEKLGHWHQRAGKLAPLVGKFLD